MMMIVMLIIIMNSIGIILFALPIAHESALLKDG